MAHLEDALELRPLLFSIAYRMLGSVADAEDIVQAAYLRYLDYGKRGHDAESPKALLTAITTRLAIDQLRSARVQRETYIGPWLPEPLLTSNEPDVAEAAVTSDSLSMAFLVLLETLSPVERAVFLLREVFAYDYDDIAGIVGKSQANCRQLAARARRHIDDGRRRFEVDSAQRAKLADRFFDAAEHGALGPLVEMLAGDVAFYGDGGRNGRGLRQPVFGRERVQRVVDGIFRAYHRVGARFQRCEVNGGPGLLAFDAEGGLINVLTVDVHDDQICTVRSVINPDKLGHLGLPLSLFAQRG
ncbi:MULTISPECIES: RNA polymerase sigma-70 factor [unclassified Mycobacterium]|uniref:RNA polymerase sigma-70 factor n=1 Tax=unclassified Mycobacterium TaxID=2642494 RepID=UPI0029C70453|nr:MULTISPECIES: RNA polymerase sigma-70 factor [unclassified Mycobacterium]